MSATANSPATALPRVEEALPGVSVKKKAIETCKTEEHGEIPSSCQRLCTSFCVWMLVHEDYSSSRAVNFRWKSADLQWPRSIAGPHGTLSQPRQKSQ